MFLMRPPLRSVNTSARMAREHDEPVHGHHEVVAFGTRSFTGSPSQDRVSPYCSVWASSFRPWILGVPGARGQEARAAGNGEGRDDLLVLLVHPAERRTAGAPRNRTCPPSWPASWAALRHTTTADAWAEHDHDAAGDDAHHGADAHGLHGEVGVPALEQVPARPRPWPRTRP